MGLSEPIGRLDHTNALWDTILPLCRLKKGEVWTDPVKGHRVGVCDAADPAQIAALMKGEKATLAVHDPPYNFSVGGKTTEQLFKQEIQSYINFSEKWIFNSLTSMQEDSHLYIWLGADQREGFQPLPELMILLRKFTDIISRSYITVRNQRGYGTQKNWMSVRQELLYYVKGRPKFQVVYTDIPKVLRGYYKEVNGKLTENLSRSRSPYIRPGNVWLDIQQVFYRMEENVPGAYAQKPLSAIDRILSTSSLPNDLVIDFFCHSGTTLTSAERLGRRCITCDTDPVFAELTIRRLEHFRTNGKTGWQCGHPFPEMLKPKGDLPLFPSL